MSSYKPKGCLWVDFSIRQKIMLALSVFLFFSFSNLSYIFPISYEYTVSSTSFSTPPQPHIYPLPTFMPLPHLFFSFIETNWFRLLCFGCLTTRVWPAGIWTDLVALIIFRCHAVNHICGEFMSTLVEKCPETVLHSILQPFTASSLSSCSYISSSSMFPESWERFFDCFFFIFNILKAGLHTILWAALKLTV